MTVADGFLWSYHLQSCTTDLGVPELLAVRLAKAAAGVLPVAGAGLSVFTDDGFRIPLGASDDMAATAERLQFTVGEGPCIEAHKASRTVLATDSLIASRWPTFHEQLVSHTPFRAIVAVPLQDAFATIGTMDLFLPDSEALAALSLDDVDVVTAQITAVLLKNSPTAETDIGPRWSNGPAATRRDWVFIAMGLLNVALKVPPQDALALLRAYAYGNNRNVDDLAFDVANRRIPASALRIDN